MTQEPDGLAVGRLAFQDDRPAMPAQRTAKRSSPPDASWAPSVAMVTALCLALLAYTVTIGADTMWLVSLGGAVVSAGTVPSGVPFMAADTADWANVAVVGQVLMFLIDGLGPAGLLVTQLVAVALTLLGLAHSARRLGASGFGTAVALLAFVLGQLPALGVVRAQVWSIPLFVLMVALLRQESQRPSRRIWLVVPLIIVWGNLHGAVLVGVAVIGAYLLLDRIRREPLTSICVGTLMVGALWITPAGLRSHLYYIGVLGNEAARRGEGLWAPIDLGSAFGWLMLISSVALFFGALRHRIPLWEYAVVAGLLVMTFQAARNGIWLAMWLVPRAAVGLGALGTGRERNALQDRSRLVPVAAGLAVVAVVTIGVQERSMVVSSDRQTARQIASIIGPDRPALATSPLSELLAVQGVTIWAGNPIDALPPLRQAAFLDFLAMSYQSSMQAQDPPEVVVVRNGDPAPPAHTVIGSVGNYTVYDTSRERVADSAAALGH